MLLFCYFFSLLLRLWKRKVFCLALQNKCDCFPLRIRRVTGNGTCNSKSAIIDTVSSSSPTLPVTIFTSLCHRSVLYLGRGSTPSAWQMGSRFAVTTIQLSALIECLARRVEYHTAPMETVRGQKTRDTPWTQTDSPACLPADTCSCHIHTS